MATTKTALELVNLVMRNLRKNQVTDLTADYTLLILEFVNQSKREIEDMIEWSHLRGYIEVTTLGSIQDYDLSDSLTITSTVMRLPNERARLTYDKQMNPMVFDITDSANVVRFREINPVDQQANLLTGGNPPATQPYTFSFTYTAGVPTLNLGEPPLADHDLIVQMHLPQDDLSAADDVMLIPWAPVVLRATALAFDERGEELGNTLINWETRYEAALQEAIDRDTPFDQQSFYAD